MAMKKPNIQPRPRGTGSITPIWDDASKTWRFKARFPDRRGGSIPGGTWATEHEAHGALNALQQSASTGLTPRGGRKLMEYGRDRIEAWPDRKNTKRGWRSTWKTTVSKAPFASGTCEGVVFGDVRDWAAVLPNQISDRTGKAIEWQTAKHALFLVKRVLADAVGDGLISVNPALGVKLPKRQKRQKGWDYLPQHEIDSLLAMPDLPEKQRSAFAFTIYTGPREGEVAVARWENMHLLDEHPHVEFYDSWDTALKNGEPRTSAILPACLPYMLHWWRLSGCPKSGLVWPSLRDGKKHTRGYDFGWGRDIDKKNGVCWLGWKNCAGIRRRVRFHDLRHTCGSHLAMGTWGRRWHLSEIQEQLGHLDIETTQRYVHMARSAMQEAAKATFLPPQPQALKASVLEAAAATKMPARTGSHHVRTAENESSFAAQATETKAARDSGFEPLTFGSGVRSPVSEFRRLGLPGQVPDMLHAILAQIAAGVAVERSQAVAIAIPVLGLAKRLAGLAGDVLSASDANFERRWRALVEALLHEPAEVSSTTSKLGSEVAS